MFHHLANRAALVRQQDVEELNQALDIASRHQPVGGPPPTRESALQKVKRVATHYLGSFGRARQDRMQVSCCVPEEMPQIR